MTSWSAARRRFCPVATGTPCRVDWRRRTPTLNTRNHIGVLAMLPDRSAGRFAADVRVSVEELRADGVVMHWDIDAETVMSADSEVDLSVLHPAWGELKRSARQEWLTATLRMLLVPPTPPDELESTADLVPVVRSRVSVEINQLSIEALSGKAPQMASSIPFRNVGGGLVACLGWDQMNTLAIINSGTLRKWSKSFEDLMELAAANMKNRFGVTPPWVDLRDGVWQLETDQPYAGSWLLETGVFDDLGLAGDPVVVNPHRRLLLVAGSDDEWGLDNLAHRSIEAHDIPTYSSLIPMVYAGETWLPFTLPKDHCAVRAFARAAANDAQINYINQQGPLEELAGEEWYVANFNAVESDDEPGRFVTYATWTDGMPTLLPEVDIVNLVEVIDMEAHVVNSKFVTFADLRDACGDGLQLTTMHPTRWQASSLPTQEVIEQLPRAEF